MAKSLKKGAAAPTFAAAPAALSPSIQRLPVRDLLDRLDTCASALEGLLDLAMPYTCEEAQRGYVPRECVSNALAPLVENLRDAVDAGWILIKSPQGEQA
jgi:hypothetical protein